MSNPFAGIITSDFKLLHKQAIEALLENTALTVPCEVTLAGTKYTQCVNCVFDAVSGKSSNRYKSGGPIPFTQGLCPYCNGVGRKQIVTTEDIYLMPIWDSKKWILSNPNLKTADISVQTMSKLSSFALLNRASKIVIDTTNEALKTTDYTRVGDPERIAFGDTTFIITSWKRA
jgi:hypothetical protein